MQNSKLSFDLLESERPRSRRPELKTEGQFKIQNFIFLITLCTFNFALLTTFALAQEDTTPAGQQVRESVRNKVKEKIQSLVNKPRALVGTINEISDSTLQIELVKDKIVQASTGQDTTYLRMDGAKKTQVSFEDLVLGDFIVAMGFRGENDVLEVKRVLTYTKSPIPTKKAVFGVVQEKEEGKLVLQHPKTLKTWVVKINKKTEITAPADGENKEITFNQIELGDVVVGTGTPDEKEENTILASRLHLIVAKKTKEE